ncbi:polysaccharide deacetylase family protein [Aliarcobacter butzleri]|uniref:polysaccharide deacetylase family protein n=1 Tax=Aliarcobacter butzleri TaxID=28197 RepID=UPI001260F128|nr:polysaccharide deacetylase family protein [Aliarcobacter butzleri]
MIKIFSQNKISKEILNKAFIRSFGNSKIKMQNEIYCFISPSENDEITIKNILNGQKSKILIFGKISSDLASLIGLKLKECNLKLDNIDFSHDRYEDKSNLLIRYNEHNLNKNNPIKNRFFYRFDFMNEWNNLGYGAISNDDSIWSICNSLDVIDCEPLSHIYDLDEKVSVFSCVKNFDNSSILYINREVATIDGLDWSIVEDFLTSYRSEELASLPIISDIPSGYFSVVSSRLDCDQSIINSKSLVELYKKYGINISLAISTGINISREDIDFLNHFYTNGGGILSHTVNHHYYWGESYNIAYEEGIRSKKWLEESIENLSKLKYAVSPFHSNKTYSIQALKDAGYDGFISGIIHNDPEYLVSTSGEVPFIDYKIVSHSQQCMLHGDCYHRRKNSIQIEKESFENHYKSGKIFGYLDHPFGGYDYGWSSDEERLAVHEEFITYINNFDGVKWMNCTEILDFVVDKSNLEIEIDKNDSLILKRNSFNSKEKIKVIYKNKEYFC